MAYYPRNLVAGPSLVIRAWLIASLLLSGLVSIGNAAPPRSQAKSAATPPKTRLPESVRQPAKVAMKVAPVKAARRSAVSAAAAGLDGLVEQKLLEMNLRPGQLASDEVFLRRVYLDVAGRIPTLAEAKRFLDSKDASRRESLIDELLSSPDYVSNFFNLWADTLRLHDRPQPNILAEPYAAYIKDTIAANRPYDQWVYEMLTADGKMWNNPATGFQFRDEGMPLPYIDNTVRVFLGTQIGCAQCHDHPFDQWTQYQFYELAAYTAGTRTRMQKGDPGFKNGNPAALLIKEGRSRFDKGRVPGSFQRLSLANTYIISEKPAKLKLPHDYAYSDAKPNEVVEPAVLWGEIPSSARNSTPREQFAAWLTSPDNPQFSKMIVNRMWKRLMGVGLVEPIDDFNDDHPCANEPLMDYLCEEMIRGNFDLKEFVRMVLYSQTYQREAFDYDITSGELYYFPGPAVRRMTAEQVWDSLLTLAVPNFWPYQRPTAEEMVPVMEIDFTNLSFEEMKRRAERYEETYFTGAMRKKLNPHTYQGNVLCRASELPSPLPADHFLRQFGQGDRETINDSSDDATVPQILAMFNGPITHVMLEPGSTLVDNVLPLSQTKDRIDAMFVSALTRSPTPADRILAAREISSQKYEPVALGNIIWALVNTREFLFIQ